MKIPEKLTRLYKDFLFHQQKVAVSPASDENSDNVKAE
jgi:hypothetical protein